MELGICSETSSLRATNCHYSEAYRWRRKALFPGQDSPVGWKKESGSSPSSEVDFLVFDDGDWVSQPRLKASSLWHTCIPCPGQALLLLFLVVSRINNLFTNLRVNSPTNGLYWLETISSLTRLEGFPSHPTLHYRRFFLSNTGESASFNASISLSCKKINSIAKLQLCF